MRTRVAVAVLSSLAIAACGTEQRAREGQLPGTGGGGGSGEATGGSGGPDGAGGAGGRGGAGGSGGFGGFGGEGASGGEGGGGAGGEPGSSWHVDGRWAPTDGPLGVFGHTALEITDAGTWIVFTTDGVLRSTDGGLSIENRPALPGSVAPVKSTWEHEGAVLASDGAALYRSNDDGISFARIADGFADIALDGGGVYALVLGGGESVTVRRSEDLGATWTDASVLEIPHRAATIGAADGKVFVRETYGGKFRRSTDGGATWSEIAGPTPPASPMIARDGELFAVTIGWVWSSTDDGLTWLPYPLAWGTRGHGNAGLHESAAGLFASTGQGVWRLDAGGTWSEANGGLAEYHPVRLSPDATGISLITTAGPMRWSAESSSWEPLPTTAAKSMILGCGAVGDRIFAGWLGLFESRDSGASWAPLSTSQQYPRYGVVGGDGFLLGHDGNRLLRSADDGVTWSTAEGSLPVSQENLQTGLPLVREADLLLPTSNGLFRSTDGGQRWLSAQAGMPERGTLSSGSTRYDSVSQLVDTGGVLLATTQEHYLLRSDDDAASWAEVDMRVSPDEDLGSAPFRTFASIGDRLYLGLHDRIVASADRGLTWTRLAGWPRDDLALAELRAVGGILVGYFSTSGGEAGLWGSADEGATWLPVGGPTRSPITCLAFAPDAIYAGTERDGMWRLPVD